MPTLVAIRDHKRNAWMLQARSDLDAEKALNALVVAAGLTPPYSHSLARLVELLKSQGVATEAFKQLHLKALTRTNAQTRYPADDEAPSDLFDANDSQQALTTAAAVVKAAAALLAG